MRFAAVLLAVVVLAGACGSATEEPSTQEPSADGLGQRVVQVERYGLALTVPTGWDAEIARGAVRFANRELPSRWGPRELEPADLVVEVLEHDPVTGDRSDARLLDHAPSLAVDAFGAPEPGTYYPESHGVVTLPFWVAGRFFVLFAESGTRPADPAAVEAANEFLATLAVEPGDFYPGEVQPASFEPADDWNTGSSGPRANSSDGDWTVTWAATIPYRDDWNALPMQKTLGALPTDGIVVWVSLSRFRDAHGTPQRWPVSPRPYRLADFEVLPGWEGQVRDLPEYRLWTRVEGQYEVDLRVYFGRADPSEEMLARAQDELERLRLPDWGPWELE